MREYVRMGTQADVTEFRQIWMDRGVKMMAEVELPVEIDLAHPGGFHEAGQLLLEILVEIRPQICPINF